MGRMVNFRLIMLSFLATGCAAEQKVTHNSTTSEPNEQVIGEGVGSFISPHGVITGPYVELKDAYRLSDDMLFPKESFLSDSLNLFTFSNSYSSYLWKNGEIAYELAPDFEWSQGLEHAIAQLARTEKVRLVRKNDSHAKWILFTHEAPPSGACGSSYVGSISAGQKIKLKKDTACSRDQKRTLLHEVMHAAGAYHEHERPDRDTYIRSSRGDLGLPKYTNSASNQIRTEYDYDSVTHYGSLQVINLRKIDGSPIAARENLSSRDVEGLNDLYKQAPTNTNSANNSGDSASGKNGCYITISSCPAQFSVPENQEFRDDWDGSSSTSNRCLARASEYMNWCNTPVEHTVKAVFFRSGQVVLQNTAVGTYGNGQSSSSESSTSSANCSFIVNAHSGKCIDVQGLSHANGTNIWQYGCNSSAAQKFSLINNGGNFLKITNIGTNKCVDVSEGSARDGGNVHQWSCVNVDNQVWEKLSNQDGTFSFKAKHSQKCLDISNASSSSGANVQQYSCNNTVAQKFRLQNCSAENQPASSVVSGDKLTTGQKLLANQFIISSNGQYRFVFQSDGNACVYKRGVANARWCSMTHNRGASEIVMQNDGNLVIYRGQNYTGPVWSTGAHGHQPSAFLVIQNDGNLVVYGSSHWSPVNWASGIH